MATKSMLKTVDISDKKIARQLVNALEKAVNNKREYKGIKCEEIKKERLKDIFG